MIKSLVQKFFLFFAIFMFFIDIVGIALFEKPVLQVLLTFYLLTIARHSTAFLTTILLFFFLCLESFFQHEGFGLPFFYVVPITILVFMLRKKIDVTPALYYGLIALCLWIKCMFIEPYMLHVTIGMPFIAATIWINWFVAYILLRFFLEKSNAAEPYKKYRTFI